MDIDTIIDLSNLTLYCFMCYGYYKSVYCKGKTIKNPYTKSDMLKSLIIGNLISSIISIVLIKVFEVYLLATYTQFTIAGSIILFALVCIIHAKYSNRAYSLIFNRSSMTGYMVTSVIFAFVDLRSSMLFLCALSLQYIYLNTNWSLTRRFANIVLLLTLVRSLTTILFSDLVKIGYTQIKDTDYWLDIISYYLVYTYTLAHWIIYYIYANKKDVQSLPELSVIEVKE